MTYETRAEDADAVVEKLVDVLEPGLLESLELYSKTTTEYGDAWLTLEDFGRLLEVSSWKQGELAISVDKLACASTKLRVGSILDSSFGSFGKKSDVSKWA